MLTDDDNLANEWRQLRFELVKQCPFASAGFEGIAATYVYHDCVLSCSTETSSGGELNLGSRLFVGLFFVVLTLHAQESSVGSTEPKSQDKIRRQQETIVVTGTFTPVTKTELDRSISMIETEGQEPLYQNWTEYLELSPSVDLRQRAPADVQGDLSIRGSTFGQTLVLLNGLRMNDAQTGHHDMDLPLPTDAVERIEILRGAGSTLYGSDAMAGTINLITSRPERSDLRFGAGIGNFGVNEQNGSASLLWRKFDTELSAERDFSSGFRPDRDYRNQSLFSSTGVQTRQGRPNLCWHIATSHMARTSFMDRSIHGSEPSRGLQHSGRS
jgi:outer membrane receptor protein involved in Fe transport